MTRPTADIAGEIRVRLAPAAGRVGGVAITSSRPVAAARVFEGLPAGAMTARIGRVFSLCGIAQTVAALRAGEQALGIVPTRPVEAARDAARLAEMVTQTAMRLALHWPRVLGLAPRHDLVRAALSLERALEAEVLGPGWRAPGAGLSGPRPDRLEPGAVAALADDPLAAILAEALAARGLEGYGALLPGQAPEAGALARNWSDPAVAAMRARHGAGLAARLAAAHADLRALPAALAAALAEVAESPPRAARRDTGQGIATVETARGPLTHRVRIAGGVVAGCETEAPTEANFAETGPVATGLMGAPLDVVAAELHVLAIDPCVGCTVEIAGR